MKFLITGPLRTARGPRRIVAFSLFFFCLFLLAHGYREIAVYGLTPQEMATNIHGSAQLPAARSFRAALEDAHVDIFLYALLLLFLDSIHYQIGPRRLLPNAAWTAALLLVLARMGALYFAPAVYLWWLAALALHLLLAIMLVRILRFLYFS